MQSRRSSPPGSAHHLAICAALLLAGCAAATKPAPDAGAPDAGPVSVMDAGVTEATDAGTAGTDAGSEDGGTDAGTADAGDAGSSDGGAGDAGAADASFLGMSSAGGSCCNQVACDQACAAQGLFCSNSCVCFHFLGDSQCAITGCPRGSGCEEATPSACEYDAGALVQPSCSSADAGFTLPWDGGLCCDVGACKVACGETQCSNSCTCANATNASSGNIPCTSDALCPLGETCYNAFDAGEYCIPGTSPAQLAACPTYACDARFDPVCPTFETCGAGEYCQ